MKILIITITLIIGIISCSTKPDDVYTYYEGDYKVEIEPLYLYGEEYNLNYNGVKFYVYDDGWKIGYGTAKEGDIAYKDTIPGIEGYVPETVITMYRTKTDEDIKNEIDKKVKKLIYEYEQVGFNKFIESQYK